MIKIILLLIVVGGFTYVGFGLFNYYKKRANFFGALINVLDCIKADIDFSNKNLGLILNKDEITSDVGVKKLIINFCNYLKDPQDLKQDDLFKGLNYLKTNEKQMIFEFFVGLGRRDCQNEIKQIENYKEYMTPFVLSSKSELIKNGKMSMKLFVLFGVLVAILLI